MNRRSFIVSVFTAAFSLLGLGKAKALVIRTDEERDVVSLQGLPYGGCVCYHCHIESMIDFDTCNFESGGYAESFPTITPATHIYATADGRWESFWCDKHAPKGSVRFRTAEEALNFPLDNAPSKPHI